MANNVYTYLVGNLAVEQLDEIVTYYEDTKEGMGLEFILSFEEAMDLLLTNPKMQDAVYRIFRRMNLKRFPYAVFYRIDEAKKYLIITAVVHEKKVTKTYVKNIPYE